MKVRIVSKGWETFTGQMGPGAIFKDGVSVEDLHPRIIARIGSSVMIQDAETGEQVGPAVIARLMHDKPIAPAVVAIKREDVEAAAEVEKEKLIEAEKEDAKKAAEALEAAKEKKVDEEADIVYTREELEAIAANDGIAGLREIGEVHGVKGRAIAEMIDEIIEAQNKKLAE